MDSLLLSMSMETRITIVRWALREAAAIYAENAQLLAGRLETFPPPLVLSAPDALRLFANMTLRAAHDLQAPDWGGLATEGVHLLEGDGDG